MSDVAASGSSKQTGTGDRVRQKDVRITNIQAAKGVADAIRTSLGPRGMDKMVRVGCVYTNYFVMSLTANTGRFKAPVEKLLLAMMVQQFLTKWRLFTQPQKWCV